MPDEYTDFYMVYVQGQRGPEHTHTMHELAKQEAERLAQLPDNRGKRVYVLKAVEFCLVENPVKWHDCQEPF